MWSRGSMMFASEEVGRVASMFTQVAVMPTLPLCPDPHKSGIHPSQNLKSHITAPFGFAWEYQKRTFGAINMITYRAGMLLTKMPKANCTKLIRVIFARYVVPNLQVARFSTRQRHPAAPASCTTVLPAVPGPGCAVPSAETVVGS